eukprot:TRINITY_DN2866_c0_g1_i1.p1 TRINITY_DN2866_c0_g1~~TRINITY_DN2866_c0_g1_i1.p1  ORF type:complete len:306 (+),score=68.52 TRINITY_DN2866_c0_g1_i1:129-920(+)
MELEAREINGFRCLPVCFDAPGKVINKTGKKLAPPHHCFYFKEHAVRKPTPETPKGRTLFLLNLPLGGTDTIRNFFEQFGKVQDVRIATLTTGSAKKRTLQSYDAAYIVFKTTKTLARVMALEYDPERRLTFAIETGSQRFNNAYDSARPPRDELKATVDAAVAAFDDEVERSKAAALAAAEPDEAGWTLVTAKTNVEAQDDEEGRPASKRARRKKKKTELNNFYRFQRLEGHQEKLALLRKRFDEDRKRMELLKASRKFKPY